MNYKEYIKALKRAEELLDLDPDPNSPDGQELLRLAERIEDFEATLEESEFD
jgi:hypothetical protein